MARRAGFSLMEMLVVLAIIALSAAIVAPRGSVMLDRITLHAVFFDFQRQVSDLRRRAWREEQALTVTTPRAEGANAIVAAVRPRAEDGEAEAVPLQIKDGFTLVFSRPLTIAADGRCPELEVEVLRGDRSVMRLKSADDACHFERLE